MSGRETQGKRVTTKNNASSNSKNTTSTANKEYKGDIKIFWSSACIAIKKLELKKYFDVFREKNINYTNKELNNAEDVLMLIQDLVDPKDSFDTNNEAKDITYNEAKFEAKKEILAEIVRQ